MYRYNTVQKSSTVQKAEDQLCHVQSRFLRSSEPKIVSIQNIIFRNLKIYEEYRFRLIAVTMRRNTISKLD